MESVEELLKQYPPHSVIEAIPDWLNQVKISSGEIEDFMVFASVSDYFGLSPSSMLDGPLMGKLREIVGTAVRGGAQDRIGVQEFLSRMESSIGRVPGANRITRLYNYSKAYSASQDAERQMKVYETSNTGLPRPE